MKFHVETMVVSVAQQII